MILALSLSIVLLSVGPALVFARNWRLYRPPPAADGTTRGVSLLIPARNEEAVIATAVEHALASTGVDLEVIVLDDHSEDGTARVVDRLGSSDPRVRLVRSPALPPRWCGKQHACHILAGLAQHDVLVFMDADVRLEPDGLSRSVLFLRSCGAGLVSGIPRQETVTFLERLLLPLIHFVLLAYLPMWRMRRSNSPAYGAGCGQFFVADRAAYLRAGGHLAIRLSMHDGITLPRAFRAAGIPTDLFDAGSIVTCRMYRTSAAVWKGLAKNATEAMASPIAIVPWTFTLGVGQVLPAAGLIASFLGAARIPLSLRFAAVTACTASYAIRLASARRFGQPWGAAVLHPLGVLVLLAVQWYALGRKLLGLAPVWKGRAVQKTGGPDAAIASGPVATNSASALAREDFQ